MHCVLVSSQLNSWDAASDIAYMLPESELDRSSVDVSEESWRAASNDGFGIGGMGSVLPSVSHPSVHMPEILSRLVKPGQYTSLIVYDGMRLRYCVAVGKDDGIHVGSCVSEA